MIAIGVILFILLIILLIPVGVDGEYISGEFKLAAKVGFFRLALIPPKHKKEKDKPQKDSSKTASAEKNS